MSGWRGRYLLDFAPLDSKPHPCLQTCEQKEAVLNIQQNQVVNLTELRADSGCVLTTVPPLPGNDSTPPGALPGVPQGAAGGGRRSGKQRAPRLVRRQILTCHNVRRFRSARERWWFLAISNCNASKVRAVRGSAAAASRRLHGCRTLRRGWLPCRPQHPDVVAGTEPDVPDVPLDTGCRCAAPQPHLCVLFSTVYAV